MPDITISEAVQALGLTKRIVNVTITGNDVIQSVSASVPAAKTGALTTQATSTTGTLTMATGHGITTAAVFDLFWAGGSRHGVVAGTVSTNSVPFSGGAGDNLPAATTAITTMIAHVEDFAVTGSNVQGYVVYSPVPAYITFVKSDNSTIQSLRLNAGDNYFWYNDTALYNPVMITNPLAGNTIAHIQITHGSASPIVPEITVIYN